MKALRYHRIGDPSVLQIDSVPIPEPGKGQVRVKVSYAGINFADTERRRGLYDSQAPLPRILGSEASGVVDAIGNGVEPSSKGKRVAVKTPECCAEYVVVSADELFEIPGDISFELAAALPVQGLTAYHLLFTAHSLRPKERVLVHSGAGGVGTILIQLSKAIGAEVFATVSTKQKADLVLSLGAKSAIRYDLEDLSQSIKQQTEGAGVDLVLDAVGKNTLDSSLACLAPFGHLISYGSASGSPPPVDLHVLLERSLKVSSYWLRSKHPKDAHRKAMAELFGHIGKGTVEPVIDRVFELNLEDAIEAHRHLEDRKTMGKLLFRVGSD